MKTNISQHTQHFNALQDQALASYFSSAGGALSVESAVLGSAIRCIISVFVA